MGFLEEILQRLEENGKHQQGVLKQKCNEHSDWLQTELLKINELIIQNPRDNLCLKSKTQISSGNQTIVEHTDEIPAPTSLPERNNGQKRKSPEMRIGGLKDSPDQKRSSFSPDWEEVACKAGLPVDLNKLKKEQLLVELESYGIKQFTMKDLKKDLIDALKERLIFDSRNVNTVIQSSDVQTEEENQPADPDDGPVQHEPLHIQSNYVEDNNTNDLEEDGEQLTSISTLNGQTEEAGCEMDA